MSWVENPGHSMFNNYNLTQLGVDQAWLNISNELQHTLWLYELSSDCHECPFIKSRVEIEPGNYSQSRVSTKFSKTYRLATNDTKDILQRNDAQFAHCELEMKMGEFGVYEITASEDGCRSNTALKPVSIYLPFLIPIFFYIGLAIVTFLYQRYKDVILQKLLKLVKSTDGTPESPENSTPAGPQRQRLRSLDTLRGICIVVMIFVNDGAASYYFLEHATWDGLYVADLVFPWFLWIMGVCIPVSIKSQVKRNTPALKILKTIAIRSFKLITIGVMLNSMGSYTTFKNLRLCGVLQRFGVCYLIVAALVLLCASDDFVNNRKANNKYVAAIQDIFFIWKGWVIVIGIVILHTCLTFLLHVPGCPTGYLGPGGLHEGNAHGAHCIGGAAGYIDRKILTLKHLYQWPTTIGTYKSDPYDPEGILGTLTSIFTVWLGVQAGLTMQVYPKHKSRLVRWAIWAVVTGAIGAALCGAKQTGGPIPINKNLWSLSYVFVMESFALILLIALYVGIDMLKIWSGTPFFEPGMNSIFLYVGHMISGGMLPWHFSFVRMNTHFKRLVEALWGTSMWVVWAIYLFHKKFFWSL